MTQYQFTIGMLLGIYKVNASATADETFDNTLASCHAFAATFDNTCTTAQQTMFNAFSAIGSRDVVCPKDGMECPASGNISGDNCIFTRKLCVSCRADDFGVVGIIMQTNGLPNHCYKSTGTTAPMEIQYDTYVNWLPATDTTTAAAAVQTQDELNAQLCHSDCTDPSGCSASAEANIPLGNQFQVNNGGSTVSSAWGIATTGALIFNGLETFEMAENTYEMADPFYPPIKDDGTANALLVVDRCLASESSGFFNYRSLTTCPIEALSVALNNNYGSDLDGSTVGGWINVGVIQNVKEYITGVYTEKYPYRSVFGISKDGRPIYTPFWDNGKLFDDCAVDICNGMEIGGHYSYVATLFHPYTMGCFGPGSNLEIYQECSTNPRLCNVEYVAKEIVGAQRLAIASSAALIAFMLF